MELDSGKHAEAPSSVTYYCAVSHQTWSVSEDGIHLEIHPRWARWRQELPRTEIDQKSTTPHIASKLKMTVIAYIT